MKKTISIGLQTFLLLLANAVGISMQPFQPKQELISRTNTTLIGHGPWRRNDTQTGIGPWYGILLMLAVYVVILLIEAARKRLPRAAIGSTIALVLAATLGLWEGFVPF